ncbi:MAG: hypothetical protein ACOC2D_14935, partial [Spirochaetota bacterium]
ASAYVEHGTPGGPGYKAVRTERYLYARGRDGTERLYDLAEDAHQTTDLLAGARAATAADVGTDRAGPAHGLLHEARGALLARIMDAEPAYPKRTAYY